MLWHLAWILTTVGEYASEGQKLGFGSFATVYLGAIRSRSTLVIRVSLGRHKQTQKVVAIKVVDIERVCDYLDGTHFVACTQQQEARGAHAGRDIYYEIASSR